MRGRLFKNQQHISIIETFWYLRLNVIKFDNNLMKVILHISRLEETCSLCKIELAKGTTRSTLKPVLDQRSLC